MLLSAANNIFVRMRFCVAAICSHRPDRVK
nr:MAG TPA: hypothetical protein [Caudoviricetes sp.]